LNVIELPQSSTVHYIHVYGRDAHSKFGHYFFMDKLERRGRGLN
jgi:hypothetical protein